MTGGFQVKHFFKIFLFSIVLTLGSLYPMAHSYAEEDATSEDSISFESFELIETNSNDFGTGTFAITDPGGNSGGSIKYPNSNITVRTGDILISSKSWDATNFVGHVAIVGNDLRVKEVLPTNPSRNVTLATHLAAQSGYPVKIYRHSSSAASSRASTWATNNISKVNYYIFTTTLSGVSWNYCSKFVYQAYKQTGTSIGKVSRTGSPSGPQIQTEYMLPNNLVYGMNYIGTYK
ncbi:hypothetical protein EVJ27_06000 [Exiguobacterium sp. SH3S2]|nr:hypothetical protein EVJ28_05995 [Exiguobacterium sp. SH3S3]TCI62093.1 hypothetical protein EVJ27_06000 [Exiguobacterium sp. SH3S2]